jgi:DNA-binding HxlR family transcriptional regulator
MDALWKRFWHLSAENGRGFILYHLLERTYRFGELKQVMRGITQRMLTKQLRELETDGIIRLGPNMVHTSNHN